MFELKGEWSEHLKENTRPDFAECFEDDRNWSV